MSSFSEDPTIKPLREVHIDGLAVLKIMKHCNDNLPTLVSGSLLGVDVDGVLEVTYAYPFPVPKGNEETGYDMRDGVEYQKDMMLRLRDMNIDDNSVGWYQSTYLGTMCSNDVVGYQYSFQTSEDLSDNSAVIMYDPISSADGGKLAIKAFRLTDKFIEMRRKKLNKFIDPSEILQELPIKIKNRGHTAAFVRCVQDSHRDTLLTSQAESLTMTNGSSYADRNLELMNSWLEDLSEENRKFAVYAKNSYKVRAEHIKWVGKRLAENHQRQQDGEDLLPMSVERFHEKPMPECPEPRTEPLLMISQVGKYADQTNAYVDSTLQKIAVTSNVY